MNIMQKDKKGASINGGIKNFYRFPRRVGDVFELNDYPWQNSPFAGAIN